MRDDEDLRWETETASVRVEQAARDVRVAISALVNLAKVHPHLVRKEHIFLSNAADDLSVLVSTLTTAEAAE